jgi:hypothetical protein
VSRVVVTKACSIQNGPTLEKLKPGDCLEATAAQISAITTAGGTTRAVGGPSPIPGVMGLAAVTRDQLGSAYAASNASP